MDSSGRFSVLGGGLGVLSVRGLEFQGLESIGLGLGVSGSEGFEGV